MNSNSFRGIIFICFMCLVILSATAKSFAQEDNSTDEQSREAQAQESLNQIHDIEPKIQDDDKRLSALEKAVADINTTAPEAPAPAAPEQAVSAQTAQNEQVPAQQATPETVPERQPTAVVSTVPVEVYPQAANVSCLYSVA